MPGVRPEIPGIAGCSCYRLANSAGVLAWSSDAGRLQATWVVLLRTRQWRMLRMKAVPFTSIEGSATQHFGVIFSFLDFADTFRHARV